MSENFPTQTAPQDVLSEQLPRMEVGAHIEALRQKYPEIAGLHEPGVDEAATYLADEFSIKPEFFEGDDAGARTLFLSSMAYRLTKVGSEVTAAGQEEREFIGNAVLVLAKDFTDAFPEIRAAMEEESGNSASDDHTEQVYKDFTQPELTAGLDEKARAGELLDDIRQKMQIGDGEEDPYEVIALSITTDESRISMLNREHVYPTSEESRADPKASIARTREIGEERDYIDDWRKGLQANTDRFTTLLNKDSANTAYMTKINGKTKLVVSQPIAERIVYNDDLENRNKVYTNDVETAERDDGRVIRHEYVHTQGGVGLPGLLIGINAEERRAEYFSGDRMGYQDIKYFFRDVRFTTGFSITDFFDKNVKGGTTEGLFAALSAEVGLDMMPEIMMMPPTNYLESQTNSVKQEIVDHLGSFSGVIGRLIGRAEKDPDMAKAMDARIQEYAQVLADSTIDDEAFNDYVIPGNRRNGSVYFIDDIAQRSAAIRAARGQKVPIPV